MGAILSGLVRVVAATLILVTAVAIGLGRRERPIADVRRAAVPRHQVISGFLFRDHLRDFSMLDVETGALVPILLPEGNKLEHASVSPWQDSEGRTHVAGMWTRGAGTNDVAMMGLAHFAGHDWSVLRLVETEQVPASAVCWFPDTTTRILYAGRNGVLYRFSFDEPDSEPETIEWQTSRPPDLLLVSDPVWSSDPALSGVLIASLAFAPARLNGKSTGLRHAELWWLKLNGDRSAIVDAGRLIPPAAPGTVTSDIEEALPALSAAVDGRLILAFLAFQKTDWTHRLRLAPLSVDDSGRLSVERGAVVEVPGNRIRARPAFSSDGRWVRAISRPAAKTGHVAKIAVSDVLSIGRASAGQDNPATATGGAPLALGLGHLSR